MGPPAFLFPLFLAGLAAAALPLVIHLIHRRRAKVIDFSTLRLLRLVERRIARRRRLEELLILLLRILAVACLALGLAAPILSGAGGGGLERALVMVVDNSMSMNAAPPGGDPPLARARAAAQALLEGLGPGDEGALVPLHRGPATPAWSRDRAALQARAAALPPTLGETPLTAGVRRALALLTTSRAARKDLVLFTDLQREPLRRLAASGLLDTLPPGTRPFLVAPPERRTCNLTVERVILRPLPARARGHRAQVVLANHSHRSAHTVLTLEVDGTVRGRREVALPPGGRKDLFFRLPDTGAEEKTGLARIGADELEGDNRRWFLVPRRRPLPLLLVHDDAPRAARLDPAFYLERALAPGEGGTLAPESVDGGETLARDLANYAAVILAEPGTLPAETAARLREWLEQGGRLLAFLGPAAESDSIARLCPGPAPEIGEAVDSGAESFVLENIDRRHPALAPLPALSPPVDLTKLRLFRYRRLRNLPPGARILARTGGGDPLLVELRPGRGRLLLFASTANPEWNDLAWRVAFLPLLHSLVHHLAEGGDRQRRHFPLERPFTLNWPPGADAPLRVRLTRGRLVQEGEVRTVPGGRTVTLAGMADPGPARLTCTGGATVREQRVLFDVHPAEGDLTRGRWRGPALTRVALTGAEAVRRAVEKELHGLSLAGPLVGLALALLVLEGLLAARAAFRREER